MIEYTVKYSSLEFNWLPNSIKKGLNFPQVRFVSDMEYGGAYYPIQDIDDDRRNLKKHALIEVDISWGDEGVAGVLAHEFRHHWQTHTFGPLPPHPWSPGGDYKQAIINYFRGAWWEMDALKYELKMSPSDGTLLWWEWLQE